jgi:hypothetical protein
MQTNNIQPLDPVFDEFKVLLVDCYNLAAEVPGMIAVYNENPLQLITICLFVKILNTTRAELLLFENNLLSEVYVSLRHQMEAVFVLKACYEDAPFLREYIKSGALYRLKLGNIISQNGSEFRENDNFDEEKVNSRKAELKAIVDENGIKEIKIQELAKTAKLKSFYNTAYRFFSNVVHVGISSLDDYFVMGADGKVRELSVFPYQKDIADLFIAAIELILLALDCINKIFKVNIEEKLKVLQERLNNLAKPHLGRP